MVAPFAHDSGQEGATGVRPQRLDEVRSAESRTWFGTRCQHAQRAERTSSSFGAIVWSPPACVPDGVTGSVARDASRARRPRLEPGTPRFSGRAVERTAVRLQ